MDEQLPHQQAFLLDRLLNSKDQKASRSALLGAKKKMGKIGLTDASAQALLDQLITDGLIEVHMRGKGISYHINNPGIEFRRTLPAAPENPAAPLKPAPKPPKSPEVDDATEQVQGFRKAFLLWQLFAADNFTLQKTPANQFDKRVKEDLDISAATANRVRASLAAEGLIEIVRNGRAESYRLTQAGQSSAITLEQHPHLPLPFNRNTLEKLRSAILASGGGSAAHTKPKQELASDLSEAAFEAFQYLRREKFSHTPLVPIYAVRRRIAELYGPDAATHAVLDEPILELWRTGRVRIIPISHLKDSTDDQRADSIGDASQTLFYME